MALVEIRDIHKSYEHNGRTLEVLRGIDLTIQAGECIAIVGPSGTGKSTLLHCIGTLDLPSKGDINLDGLEITKLSSNKLADLRNRAIGFVFQFHHLLPEFTALENVSMPGLIQGKTLKEMTGRAKELLEVVGLKDRASHRPGELSGGEQQRVAVARALSLEPKILLADEPTGNLDTATSDAIHDLFFQINKERGTTIVVVTHNAAFAEQMPRVVRMRDGKVEKDERGTAASYRAGTKGDGPIDPQLPASEAQLTEGTTERSRMLLPFLSFCERLVSAVVAPAVCAACEEPVAEGVAFCGICAQTIERFAPHASRRAGSLLAIGAYGGALGDAIRRLKYQQAPWIARPLGDLLAARCLEEGCAPDLVVPVPMPRERLLARGYNQAALLATRLGRVGFTVDPCALERTRESASQATLRRDARLENLRGAFRARRDLRGVVVLLVDDVTTTGGTLAACQDAVQAAGGIVTSAAVLAIVDQDDDYVEAPREESSASISSANPLPRAPAVT